MKQIVVFSIAILFLNVSFSQTVISGALISNKEKPIFGASITIFEIGSDRAIAYDISDDKGKYRIIVSSTEKELVINVQSLGYKKISKILSNQTHLQNFVLQESQIELKEAILKAYPITRKGDTLNYSVNTFVKEQDRSISDVLKRMPGIEVLNDGRVLYEGKPINKYYIEGLDLLAGKYNLANKNLPAKEVSRVQILENHQPIKILDSLEFSERAAINIKLKNSYTITGQAEVASGMAPFLWDVNLSPMLFSKKRQVLTSYQTNNTGNDIGTQLKTLTVEDLMDQMEDNSEKKDWLGIQQLNPPNFAKKRWLDNNSHLFTANFLQKLKSDYELRFNFSYLNDYQKQNGLSKTRHFLPTDTIALLEVQDNQLYINSLEANLSLQKNTKSGYLKNSLQFHGFWDSQTGVVYRNDEMIAQNLDNPYFKISNRFKAFFPWKKQLLKFSSYFEIDQTPQTLTVNPGQFNDLLNQGNFYDEALQKIDLGGFYTKNSIGFTKGWGDFSFSPKIGFQFENQYLESKLATSENLSLDQYYSNSLYWKRSKTYLYLQTQYKKERWRLRLETPLNLHSHTIEDESLQKSQKSQKLTFDPRFSIIYDVNTFWKLNASIGSGKKFGTIDQLHYGFILKDYKSLIRVDAPLSETLNQDFTGGVFYRNSIESLFWNLFYTYTTTDNNLIYNTKILESGSSEIQAIRLDNTRISNNFSSRFSKYFNVIKTSVTLNANYSSQDFEQILNTELTDIKIQNWGIGGKLDMNFTNWFNVNYKVDFLFSKNKIQENPNRTLQYQIHAAQINLHPKEMLYFSLKSEYMHSILFSENTKNVFIDLVWRYIWKQKNIDFEIQWNNILNSRKYRVVSADAFSYVETDYQLRPSQVMFKMRFSL
ncbi:hypothetical protein [Aequorivita marina]|uniref:hypothetical protein n=1 Tax=Aequorivita marina TaxID=3073654 RepID=UPI002874219C|nr:hypothetical protein [Aequorivita sp. S2608]MDS1296796.1 hypothetical protein [Aequorivita sp. S2608]